MPLDLPFWFFFFCEGCTSRSLDSGSLMSMSIINTLELGPIACESNVLPHFQHVALFFILILGLELNPIWQTHHFQKRRGKT
jgi:hypothetical protein